VGVLWVMPRLASRYSKPLRPPVNRAVSRSRCRSGWIVQAVLLGGGQKGADHALTGDAAVGVAGEQAKGAVIKPVEDLHIAAIG
jgi:hypothetical protein